MSFRYPAGVVGTTVTPSGPYQNSTASGAWSLAAQANFKAQSLWPTAGNAIPFTLYAWGTNSSGELGLGNTTAYSSPKQVGTTESWASVEGGRGSFTAGIKTDGTLYLWGANGSGQLGLGNTTGYSSPKQVGALTTWYKVSTGGAFTVSIKTDGTLWSWGLNNYGQLGHSNYANRSSPVQVGALTTWASLATPMSSNSALAIKTDGTLWAWGNNASGQLGLNDTNTRSIPVQVGALTTWSKVTCSQRSTTAVKTDGTLWSWGNNGNGQLGLDSAAYSYSSPKQVGALTNWLTVAGGYNSVMAIKTDGTLWAWGANAQGTLGDGTTYTRSSPVQIGALTTWLLLSLGNYGGLARKTDGTLWTWGGNSTGALGLGNTTNYSSPKQVGVLTTWLSVARSASSSFATKTP